MAIFNSTLMILMIIYPYPNNHRKKFLISLENPNIEVNA
jgi:hypothetical protein